MNRPAPNLQLGLGTNYDVGSCIQQYFLSTPGTNSAKKSNKRFKYSFFAMFCFEFFAITTKAGERGGGGAGGKIPGARTGLGARNLDKTSGHCATVKRVGGP